MFKRFLILLLMTFALTCSVLAKNDSIAAPKKHNPKKATIYSAVLPGLGQAYNKKYWKIPIVYTGIGTIAYIAYINNDYYKDYRAAFDYKTGTITEADEEVINIAKRYSQDNLITIRDYYRRNVELSWIIMALWYGLNVIDACVDAHFFEYDISDDLTLKMEPMIQSDYAYWGQEMGTGYGKSYGVSLKLKF